MLYSKKLEKERAALLREPLTGSTWMGAALYHLGNVESPICKLCNVKVEQTLDHIVWECPCFKTQRREHDPELADIPIKTLPRPLNTE